MPDKMHIMVVDDELIIRESFSLWFQKSGHFVETAESGFNALEKLEKDTFDVLFVDIKMPPLRKRKEDIPLLVTHFLQKYSQETNKHVDRIGSDALRLLKNYDWPGNIRELQNAVERAVVLAKGRTLGADSFSFLQATDVIPSKRLSLHENEREYIRSFLEESEWNVTRAANILDINRVTLHKKIKRLGLKRNEP